MTDSTTLVLRSTDTEYNFRPLTDTTIPDRNWLASYNGWQWYLVIGYLVGNSFNQLYGFLNLALQGHTENTLENARYWPLAIGTMLNALALFYCYFMTKISTLGNTNAYYHSNNTFADTFSEHLAATLKAAHAKYGKQRYVIHYPGSIQTKLALDDENQAERYQLLATQYAQQITFSKSEATTNTISIRIVNGSETTLLRQLNVNARYWAPQGPLTRVLTTDFAKRHPRLLRLQTIPWRFMLFGLFTLINHGSEAFTAGTNVAEQLWRGDYHDRENKRLFLFRAFYEAFILLSPFISKIIVDYHLKVRSAYKLLDKWGLPSASKMNISVAEEIHNQNLQKPHWLINGIKIFLFGIPAIIAIIAYNFGYSYYFPKSGAESFTESWRFFFGHDATWSGWTFSVFRWCNVVGKVSLTFFTQIYAAYTYLISDPYFLPRMWETTKKHPMLSLFTLIHGVNYMLKAFLPSAKTIMEFSPECDCSKNPYTSTSDTIYDWSWAISFYIGIIEIMWTIYTMEPHLSKTQRLWREKVPPRQEQRQPLLNR